MGGDDFLVFMKNFTSLNILHEKATALCNNLNVSRVVEGIDLRIAISVGIAICPTDGTDFASLYRNADSALYVAKQNGKNTLAYERPKVRSNRMTLYFA